MLEVQFTKKLLNFNLEAAFKVDREILVLWGPSGSGKTTILQCLAGLSRPSAGSIVLDKRVLYSSEEKIDIAPRFRKIGYVFQEYALFPHMTVRQNIYYGIGQNSHRYGSGFPDPMELLGRFELKHLIDRRPGQLSVGEKQRVALIRALAVQPRLLLLDEPFSALDRGNKLNLMLEIKKIHRAYRMPLVLVTHDEEEAAFLGDSVISLVEGVSKKKELQPAAVC